MKINIFFFSLGLICLLFTNCKREKIALYDSGNFVHFTSSVADTLNFSFFFHPGKDEVRLGLPLRMVGKVPPANLEYVLSVSKESNAPDYIYNVPAVFQYDRELAVDTAFIIIKNHPSLVSNIYNLIIQIEDNGQIKPGQTTHAKRVIKISDQVVQPLWWDADIVRFYLGAYSELKFRAFMSVTGIGDISAIEHHERRILMLKFKYYLIEQKQNGTPLLLEDGRDMLADVPVAG